MTIVIGARKFLLNLMALPSGRFLLIQLKCFSPQTKFGKPDSTYYLCARFTRSLKKCNTTRLCFD